MRLFAARAFAFVLVAAACNLVVIVTSFSRVVVVHPEKRLGDINSANTPNRRILVIRMINVDPTRLKTDRAKLQKQTIRNNNYNNNVLAQAIAAGTVTVKGKASGTGNSKVKRIGPVQAAAAAARRYPIYELFARRRDTGLWTLFQEIVGDTREVIQLGDMIEREGGLESELSRPVLGQNIARLLIHTTCNGDGPKSKATQPDSEDGDNKENDGSEYSKSTTAQIGMGGQLKVVAMVKDVLPQFKKVKNRDLEFGYRQLVNSSVINTLDELLWSTSSAAVAAGENHIWSFSLWEPSSTDVKKMRQGAAPADVTPIDAASVIERAPKAPFQLPDLRQSLASTSITTTSTTTDGISSLNDHLIRFLLALSVRADGDASSMDKSTIIICSDGSANIQEKTAAAGVSVVALIGDSSDSTEASMVRASFGVQISRAGGLVDTPFDAELVAGLAALSIGRFLVQIQHDQKVALFNRMEYITDSKTLTRAIRTGPSSETGDLAVRTNSSSRSAMWALMMDHVAYISSLNESLSWQYSWYPGHPERRQTSTEKNKIAGIGTADKWSIYDHLIYTSDSIAGAALTTWTDDDSTEQDDNHASERSSKSMSINISAKSGDDQTEGQADVVPPLGLTIPDPVSLTATDMLLWSAQGSNSL
jgi:hypothetical protein